MIYLIFLFSNESLSSWPSQYSAIDCFLLASTLADTYFILPFPVKSAGDRNNNNYHLLSTSYLRCTKNDLSASHIFSHLISTTTLWDNLPLWWGNWGKKVKILLVQLFPILPKFWHFMSAIFFSFSYSFYLFQIL